MDDLNDHFEKACMKDDVRMTKTKIVIMIFGDMLMCTLYTRPIRDAEFSQTEIISAWSGTSQKHYGQSKLFYDYQ